MSHGMGWINQRARRCRVSTETLSKAWYTGISWGKASNGHKKQNKSAKPHSTTDQRCISSQWRSIQLRSATKYCHCIMILKLWAFWEDSPQNSHTPSPRHPKVPVSSKLRTIVYMQTPIQQYLIIHTANEGKTKSPSHSNTKTAGAIEEFKRHEPHTWYTGQCSVLWGYILALLWIKKWHVCNATSKSHNHIWTFLYQCYVYMDEAMQDRRPDRDVQFFSLLLFNFYFT